MRVLVTGSSGHVGGAVAAHLFQSGHEVLGLSRRHTTSSASLSNTVAADLGTLGLADLLSNQHRRCEAMVHAGAAIERGLYGPEIALTNCLGVQQMLELGARWEVERFIFISGVAVIGRPLELPVTEEHPANPPTAYHASKLFGEQLVALAAEQGIPALTLRLTAPVGPGMRETRILPVFVRRALRGERLELIGRGTRCQDYVDVRDAARAVAAALERHAGGLLNIGSGRCVSNLALARLCVELLGSSSEIVASGRPDPEEGVRWEVSIARARTALGYRPRCSLEDSIAAMASELRAGARV
jgi:nucleoside-diphosphate-sugar epimerase